MLAASSASAQPRTAPSFAALSAALDAVGGDSELALFDAPPGKRVLVVRRVRAPIGRVTALIADPAAYQRALPELVRFEPVETRWRAPALGPDRKLAWELEVPLWNLSGAMWLRPRPQGLEMELVTGHFAPGTLVWTVRAEAAARTLVAVSANVNVREATYVTRKLAQKNALAEPAMSVTAAWALLRALALEAERGGAQPEPRRWPKERGGPPRALRVEGVAAAATALPDVPVLAAITSRPDGRLDQVAIALPLASPASDVRARLREPARWQAVPGWKEVTAVAGNDPARWEVDSKFPFVDFDAVWALSAAPGVNAHAVDGDTEGARLLVDARPRGQAGSTFLFASYPRIEKTGYFPRKFVEAEPLLEAGLSAALAYVNAFSLSRAVGP